MRDLISSLVLLAAILLPQAGWGQTSGDTERRSAATTRTIPSSPADDEYQLGAEDVIDLQVWGRPDLTGLVTVGVSGEIQAPLLGAIRAEGRTPAELTEDLTERYQLLDPSISEVLASVAQYNSRAITILGAVESPGVYGFREIPDVWEALLIAGGPTAEAELARVQIVRQRRSTAEPRTVRVNLARGIDNTPPESLPELRAKDTILVPSGEDVPSVGEEKYQVIGSVREPGVYRLSTAGSVLEAISVSGGPAPEADLSTVHLLRRTSTGTISYELDLQSLISEADPLADMELRPGDTISVSEKASFFTSLTEQLRLLAPFLSLATTVILATN